MWGQSWTSLCVSWTVLHQDTTPAQRAKELLEELLDADIADRAREIAALSEEKPRSELVDENGNYRPERERAMAFVRNFSLEDWNRQLLDFIGTGAEAMIEGEEKEHKYSPEKHEARFAVIEKNWDLIIDTIGTLPSPEEIRALMESIGFPTSASIIGYDDEQVKKTFTMTKDIRDKYVGTRLFWDLGILGEIADKTFTPADR